MEESLSNEYWKKRCELAEKVVEQTLWNKSALSTDLIKAFDEYHEFIKNPISTALYTGFIDLLRENDMWYEFHEPSASNDQYQLMFGKNGTDFQQAGTICEYTSVCDCFEAGLNCLKDAIKNGLI